MLGGAFGAALFATLISVALAQPRGRGRTKPPKVTLVPDAGAIPSTETGLDDAGSGTSVSPLATPDGGAGGGGSGVSSHAEGGDGGKLSPLNPQPNEVPSSAPTVPSTTVDYDSLLGEISALRARVAAVGDSLFHSRIGIALVVEGDHGKLGRLTISLDDGAVFTAKPGFRADDPTAVYEHAVAPGRHAITVDVDRKDERDEAFRSSQRTRFVVEVPKDQRLGVELRLNDESTMGADFPADQSGRYDLRVRMKASARPATR